MGICTWTLAYLVLHAGRGSRLGIRENKRAYDFGGNYPNSPSYQLLHRIYDTSIAIRNDQLQKFEDNGTPKDKNANKHSSGIGCRKQKADYGERADMFQ
jgi:molybdopterin-guanine dinucleotide biosynthesis protein A